MSWDPNAATSAAASWDPNAATSAAASWDPNAATSSAWQDPNAAPSSVWQDPNAAPSSSAWQDPNAAPSSTAWEESATSSEAWVEPAPSSSWDQAAPAPSAPAGEPAPSAPSAPSGSSGSNLPASRLLPLPYDPSQPPFGGTPEAPAYFFDSTLPPEGDVSCSTTYRNVTQLCCPTEIGIWDAGTGGSSCRMRDVQENKDWMANCTAQVWLENNPWERIIPKKSHVRCMPFQEKINEREKDRRETLRVTAHGQLGCGTLGTFDEKHNFTGQCCETLGGQRAQNQLLEPESGDPAVFPQQCLLNPDQEDAWEACISELGTYGTCTTAYRMPANLINGAERLRPGAGLVALAVALAAVV